MKWLAILISSCIFYIDVAFANESTRIRVPFPHAYTPGTIVIVNRERHLYLVMENNVAFRYTVAVGRSRAQWVGVHTVMRKAENPHWTPTANMRKKRPGLKSVKGGSRHNPLGARALYLYGMYRIHGTNEPKSIGSAASSGCFRMLNADVIDLYNRVPVGTKVVVVNTLPSVTALAQ